MLVTNQRSYSAIQLPNSGRQKEGLLKPLTKTSLEPNGKNPMGLAASLCGL